MVGAPVENLHVNVGARTAGEALEEIMDQLRLQVSYQARSYLSGNHGGGASTKIDSRQPQGFVHRHQKVSGAHDAAIIAQSLRESFTQGQPRVFHGVVLVHVEVAAGFEL